MQMEGVRYCMAFGHGGEGAIALGHTLFIWPCVIHLYFVLYYDCLNGPIAG